MAVQKGKIWTDHLGRTVPVEYLHPQAVKLEKAAGQLTTLAESLEQKVRQTKELMATLMMEAIEIATGSGNTRSFYSFDHQYRFEIDQENGYIRVYRATKPDPSSKDYEPVNLDFTRVKVIDFAVSSIDSSKIQFDKDKGELSLKADSQSLPPMLPTEDELILNSSKEIDVTQRHKEALAATGTEPPVKPMITSTVEDMMNDGPKDDTEETAVDHEINRINEGKAVNNETERISNFQKP